MCLQQEKTSRVSQANLISEILYQEHLMGPVFLGTLFEKHCPRCPRSPEVLSSWLWPSLVWSWSWRKMLRKLQVAGVGSWHPLPTLKD